MEIFYEGWNIVKQFINANGNMPKEINLCSPLDRLVCKELVSRSKFPILDVIEVIKTMSQPHLLDVTTEDAVIESNVVLESKVSSIVAPLSIYSN